MTVLAMMCFIVFLPSLAAQHQSRLKVDIDETGELLNKKPIIRAHKSAKQEGDALEPNTEVAAILADGMPKKVTHDKAVHNHDTPRNGDTPKPNTEFAAILADGMPKVTHDKALHDTPARMSRQHQTEEETTGASFDDETRAIKSAPPTGQPFHDENDFIRDILSIDHEQEEESIVTLLNGKAPKLEPMDCTWNNYQKKGGCMPVPGCTCGCTGEQEYRRTIFKPAENGGRCDEQDTKKTKVCDLPPCPATAAPSTEAPTFPPYIPPQKAFATRMGSIHLVLLLGLFTVTLFGVH